MILVKPNGEISKNRANKFPLVTKTPLNNLMYCAEKFFGWGFDESDQKGVYYIKIRIYDETQTITEYNMKFTLE